jgi:hypothetical protein
MQIQNDVEACPVEASNVGPDRLAIASSAVPGGSAVDTQPAVFVQWNAHGVDPPGRHRGDGAPAGRSSEKSVPADTRVFGPRPVHPKQADRLAVTVDEMVVHDMQAWIVLVTAPGTRRDQRERQCQDERYHHRSGGCRPPIARTSMRCGPSPNCAIT